MFWFSRKRLVGSYSFFSARASNPRSKPAMTSRTTVYDGEPALLGSDLDRRPVHLRRVRRRPAQGHALDHLEQLIRQPMPALVRSPGSTQPGRTRVRYAVSHPLRGPQRHPRRGRRLHQRDPSCT